MYTNVELFLTSIESRDLTKINDIISDDFIEELPDGGVLSYAKYIPQTNDVVREYVDDVRTSSKKITIVTSTYCIEDKLRDVTCLVWESREGGKWFVDKFFLLRIEETEVGNVS